MTRSFPWSALSRVQIGEVKDLLDGQPEKTGDLIGERQRGRILADLAPPARASAPCAAREFLFSCAPSFPFKMYAKLTLQNKHSTLCINCQAYFAKKGSAAVRMRPACVPCRWEKPCAAAARSAKGARPHALWAQASARWDKFCRNARFSVFWRKKNCGKFLEFSCNFPCIRYNKHICCDGCGGVRRRTARRAPHTKALGNRNFVPVGRIKGGLTHARFRAAV